MSNVRPIRPAAPEPHPPRPEDLEGAASDDPVEAEYRRRRRPVPVRQRRGEFIPRWAGRVRRGWKPALAAALIFAAGFAAYNLVFQSSWFRLRASDQIAVLGARQTSPAEVQSVFASDLGRNLFFIPLQTRRREVENIAWVRQAAVVRIWPDRLQVILQERTPVAFARVRSRLEMIDSTGVLLRRPAEGNFNFPVLTGLQGVDSAHPDAPALAALRRAQVARWMALEQAVDAGGNHASAAFSEVNLSDPGDIRVRVSLPGSGSVLVALGDRNFGPRYQLFQSQIASWRQKYPRLQSVDLRFDGQAIVDPGPAAPVQPSPGTTSGAGASVAKHPRGVRR